MVWPSAAFLTRIEASLYHLAVRVTPGARTSSVVAPIFLSDGAIGVRVAAPPVEGKANTELVEYLEDALTQELKNYLSDPSVYLARKSALKEEKEDTGIKMKGKTSSVAPLRKYGEIFPSGSEMIRAKKGEKKSCSNAESQRRNEATIIEKPQLQESASDLTCSRQSSRVAVTVVKGHSARNKVVAISFPASEEHLIVMLENISS